MKETLIIANLKCSGCAATITENLSKIEGVQNVQVDPDNDSVSYESENSDLRNTVVNSLKKLGYPEATEENGLLLQIKSYASCMIGRLK